MTEPNTLITAAAATGISFGSMMLGMDAETAIGALAGATIFVASEKDIHPVMRVVYLLVSVIFGYLAAPEIIENSWITTPAVAGFTGGLLGVTASQLVLKHINNGDIGSLFRGLKK